MQYVDEGLRMHARTPHTYHRKISMRGAMGEDIRSRARAPLGWYWCVRCPGARIRGLWLWLCGGRACVFVVFLEIGLVVGDGDGDGAGVRKAGSVWVGGEDVAWVR